MTPEEHKKRHRELHDALDELVADFIRHTEKSLGSTTIVELLLWSHEQTKNPANKEPRNGG
jgi:hypothetical protein